MKKRKLNKVYYVDIPDREGRWNSIEHFQTKREALKFVQEGFGADRNGKVRLITEVKLY